MTNKVTSFEKSGDISKWSRSESVISDLLTEELTVKFGLYGILHS